jgi:hypothetical protein
VRQSQAKIIKLTRALLAGGNAVRFISTSHPGMARVVVPMLVHLGERSLSVLSIFLHPSIVDVNESSGRQKEGIGYDA